MKARSREGWTRRKTTMLIASAFAGAVLAGCSSNDDGGDASGTDAPNTGAPGDGTPADPDVAALGIPSDDDAMSFSEGVVTAANPIAAEEGRMALANGGNAIDAAAVVQFVLNVVEPTSSGIGGGGFMGIHRAETGRTFFIDSREKAPAAATPTQYLACDPDCTDEDFDAEDGPARIGPGFTDIATSGIGVGVPGTLLGVAHALEEYGTFTLAEALAPAIALARDGFVVNDRLSMLIGEADEVNRTTFYAETRDTFRPGGVPLAAGDTLVQADLADTFQAIADGGVEAFYTGDIAEAIVAAQMQTRDTVGDQGVGRMTTRDLADYLDADVVEREPTMTDYRGYTLMGMPFPSSGGLTVGQILDCVEQFDLGNEDAGFGQGAPKTLHVMVESMRLAFASRSVWMGDDDAESLTLPVAGLQSPDYLMPRCGMISTGSRLDGETVVPGDPRAFDPDFADVEDSSISTRPDGAVGIDTTHFSIIDANGNVVSYTSTIEGTWGSGITVPGFGFLLNNELTDFNFTPQMTEADAEDFAPGANDVAPGKRPRSSMAPTLVFDGDTFLAAYGSPGGSTIINSVVNTTINLIDHGLDVQAAIDAPRISSGGGSVSYEEGFEETALEALRTLGHTLRDAPSVIGSVQAVVVDSATMLQYGGADSRRVGTVVGLPDAQ